MGEATKVIKRKSDIIFLIRLLKVEVERAKWDSGREMFRISLPHQGTYATTTATATRTSQICIFSGQKQ